MMVAKSIVEILNELKIHVISQMFVISEFSRDEVGPSAALPATCKGAWNTRPSRTAFFVPKIRACSNEREKPTSCLVSKN